MKVLFVVSRVPYPPWRGDQVRAYHLLRVLAKRHRITCAVLALRPPNPVDLQAVRALGVDVVVHPLGLAGAIPAGLRAVLGVEPFQVTLYRRARAEARLTEVVARGSFDLVHAQLVRTAPYALPLADRVTVVVDLVDALSLAFQRRSEREPWPLRMLARSEAARLRAYESWVLARAAQSIVVAPEDAAAVGGDQAPVVVPNGVLATDFDPPGPSARIPGRIVFAGNLGYFPNVDAACWLAESVLPRIRAGEPTAHLRLVGARPSRAVRALARREAVSVVANVPNMSAELSGAALTIISMRTGAGVQNKTLEALAARLPVVTTPMVVRALGLTAGENVLVGADAPALAEQAIRLIRSPELGTRLAARGRALVEQAFSWDVAGDRVDMVWRQACSGHP